MRACVACTTWSLAADSTPSWCAGAWQQAATRHVTSLRPGTSPWEELPPSSPTGWWLRPKTSSCGRRRVASSGAAVRSSTPRSSALAVDVEGRHVLDAGASTGGFTDCVLQRGAALGRRCRRGPRPARRPVWPTTPVWSFATARTSATWARAMSAARSTSSLPICRSSRCAPCSTPCIGLCRPGGDLVLLVKPQFEAGRGRGGARAEASIRDEPCAGRVRDEIAAALRDRGAVVRGLDRVTPRGRRREPRVARARHRAGRSVTTPATVVVVAHHERPEAALCRPARRAMVGSGRPPRASCRRRRRSRRARPTRRDGRRDATASTWRSASAATAPCCARSTLVSAGRAGARRQRRAASGTSPSWNRRAGRRRARALLRRATTRSRSG